LTNPTSILDLNQNSGSNQKTLQHSEAAKLPLNG